MTTRSHSRPQETLFILCILAIGLTTTLIVGRVFAGEINNECELECSIDSGSLWHLQLIQCLILIGLVQDYVDLWFMDTYLM